MGTKITTASLMETVTIETLMFKITASSTLYTPIKLKAVAFRRGMVVHFRLHSGRLELRLFKGGVLCSHPQLTVNNAPRE